jgi:hypothetical protein
MRILCWGECCYDVLFTAHVRRATHLRRLHRATTILHHATTRRWELSARRLRHHNSEPNDLLRRN